MRAVLRYIILLSALSLAACQSKKIEILPDPPGPPDIETLMLWADHDQASKSRIYTFVNNFPKGEAVAQIQIYADRGDPEALTMLAFLLSEQGNVDPKIVNALWVEAYEKGNGAAAFNLLYNEIGKASDDFNIKKALEYEAALRDRMPSLYFSHLAQKYMRFDQDGAIILSEVVRTNLDHATTLGSSHAPWVIAEALLNQGDPESVEEALPYLEVSYRRGDYQAGLELASHYASDGSEAGRSRSRAMLKELSSQGYAKAQWTLYRDYKAQPETDENLLAAQAILDQLVAKDASGAVLLSARLELSAAQKKGDEAAVRRALERLDGAGEAGDVEAWHLIADHWTRLETIDGDHKATEAFIRAFKMGDDRAMVKLISYFTNKGNGHASHPAEAFLRDRVENGVPGSAKILWTFLYNRDLENTDWRDINSFLEPEWDRVRDPVLANTISANYQLLEEWDDAVQWSRRAARTGETGARMRYAMIVSEHGQGFAPRARAIVHMRNLIASENEDSRLFPIIHKNLAKVKAKATPEELSTAETLQETCAFPDPLRCETIWTDAQLL